MNTGVLISGDATVPPNEPQKTYSFEGWLVHEYATVHSTNLVAAELPAWTALRADTQTAGRGRFQRAWVSDRGGLWFSVTIPCPAGKTAPRSLPLTVGLAVCEALKFLGVGKLRMRWPNDVLVDHRKLAGILLDQFAPGIAVAGIGINVRNHPEGQNADLKDKTIRLTDILPNCPALPELMHQILRSLRHVHQELQQFGFDALLPRINRLWGTPRRVELDLDGEYRRGVFTQVDQSGRLILAENNDVRGAYEPNAVRHLREI